MLGKSLWRDPQTHGKRIKENIDVCSDTYGYITKLVAGQLIDMYFNEVVSKKVEDADGIAFGKAVVRGTSEDQVALGVGSFGISVRELTREADKRGVGAATQYDQYAAAAILRKGHVAVELVTAASGVSAGDTVAAMANGDIVASGTTSSTDIAGATFEKDAVAGDVVEIRLA